MNMQEIMTTNKTINEYAWYIIKERFNVYAMSSQTPQVTWLTH